MKALSIILALLLGVGFFAAAVWMSSANQQATATGGKPAPRPADAESVGPKISTKGPYPKAVVSETEYDFGTQMFGTKGGNHDFVIRNEGEAPLELVAREEDRTCQCTGAELKNDGPIPPGGETTAHVTWKIELENANFRHSAKIRTNDPNNRIIELVIKGKVEKTFQYDPPGSVWDLGEINPDHPVATSTRSIYSQALDQFDITKIHSKNPFVKCSAEPLSAAQLEVLEAKSGYQLRLEADFSSFSGVFSEPLEITTSSQPDSPILLHIKARKMGPVDLIARNWDPQTNRLTLGEFPASEGKHAEISVYTRVNEDVKLLSAKSEHDAVKVVWEKDEQFQSKSGKTRRYKLKIEVPPAAPVSHGGSNAEKVDLEFDHPEIGTVRILVVYLSI